MKKLIFLFLVAATFVAKSQNLQVHYDLGEDREYITTTFEMFKVDKWGNTFTFIDFDHHSNDKETISLAYWEIARTLKLGKTPFSFHGEYNGGMATGFDIKDCWLGGLDYSWNNKDFSKGFSAKVLYKYIDGIEDASFQLTGVWYMHFLNRKVSFTGFVDFWKERKDWQNTDYVFLTEPQLWYNFNKHFSLGSEVEISNNFVTDKVKIMPTVAAKWNF